MNLLRMRTYVDEHGESEEIYFQAPPFIDPHKREAVLLHLQRMSDGQYLIFNEPPDADHGLIQGSQHVVAIVDAFDLLTWSSPRDVDFAKWEHRYPWVKEIQLFYPGVVWEFADLHVLAAHSGTRLTR
ncbi:MAG: hypothetical protein DI585_07015, partial [Pseudomonas fluorescens]